MRQRSSADSAQLTEKGVQGNRGTAAAGGQEHNAALLFNKGVVDSSLH